MCFDHLPSDDILYLILNLLDPASKRNLAQTNQRFNHFCKTVYLDRHILSSIHDYKFDRDKRYHFRNCFYNDKERERRVDDLKNDVKSLFKSITLKEGILLNSKEFGYTRIHSRNNVNNSEARKFAVSISKNSIFIFPFDFDIRPYCNKLLPEEINLIKVDLSVEDKSEGSIISILSNHHSQITQCS
jgi:hypothetical protein